MAEDKPQAETPAPEPKPAPNPVVKSEEPKISVEWHERVKRERDDAQAKLREIEEKQSAAEKVRLAEQGEFKKMAEAAESELQKAKAASDEQRKSYEGRLLLREVRAVAASEGLENLADAKFIDLSGVEYDADKDEVAGVIDAVRKFKAEHPRFFKADSLDDAPKKPTAKGAAPPPPASGATPEPKDAFTMNADEFAAAFKTKFPQLV